MIDPGTPTSGEDRPREARDVVIRRLAAQARVFPDLELAPLDTRGLDARDARFASALYAEVIRRWLTLEYLLDQRLNQPVRELEAKAQAVLLAGAAQILLLEHVPPHAAVDESAGWAKRNIRAGAAGLVNAVLRRVADLAGEVVDAATAASGAHEAIPLSDGRQRLLRDRVLPAERLARLASATGHPRALVQRWAQRYSAADLERLLLHNLMHPPVLMRGVTEQAARQSTLLRPHRVPGFSVFTGGHAELLDFLAAHPQVVVQDPAAWSAVAATSGLPIGSGLIVDFCAGQGTKTMGLAELHPQAKIIATDVDGRRLAILRRRFEGHARVRVLEMSDLLEYSGRADLLFLDVPCSNSGVLPRRVEARYRIDQNHLKSLVNLQRQIIADSLRLRAPAGRILYSTCSLEPAENQEQTQWVRTWHRLTVQAQNLSQPRGGPMGSGGDAAEYSDGGFYALIG